MESGVSYTTGNSYASQNGNNSSYFRNLPTDAQFGIMMALMYGWHEGKSSPVAGTNADDYAYATQSIMAGCFWQYDVSPIYCGASIARYNMETGEYEEKHFPYTTVEIAATDYKYLTKHGAYFYAILNESLLDKDSTDRQNKVDIIDSETLELVDTLVFNGRISGICFVGDDLYIVIADKLCKYDVETNAVEEIYTFPENTNIESSHMRDGHIYYNTRYLPVQKDGKMWNVGYIIDFNTANNSVKQTPLITDAKNTESIVFFPLGVTDN